MEEVNAVQQRSAFGRLYPGETSFDFMGKKKIGFTISLILILMTIGSLFTRGLNLGIDFEGGVAWQVPVTATMDSDAARAVLTSNGIEADNAKIQILTNGSTKSLRIQVGDQTPELQLKVKDDLATASKTDPNEVSVSSVSSSWGRSITEKAIQALIIFIA